MSAARRILIIGYGNPGRGDDGLGPALAAMVEREGIDGVIVHEDYQLTVESAQDVAQSEMVIFADASMDEAGRFSIVPILPVPSPQFDSHSLSPGTVLYLALTLFGAKPEAYLVSIRGYEFDRFGESLSKKAEANLAAAAKRVFALLSESVSSL
ncbi:MAG: hydrogenase maturation protease [Nitrospinota bacterium]|nr:hydrogenase maturation protease [Nitrospinota bacterium]